MVSGYFRLSVEDLKRRDVLGRGVDCQVEASILRREPSSGGFNERRERSGGLLLAV